MTKQIHFVVLYDEETDTFEMDYETLGAKFNDETVWDVETEVWCHPDPEELPNEVNLSGDILAKAIKNLSVRNNND
jgi:hypothetical protein